MSLLPNEVALPPKVAQSTRRGLAALARAARNATGRRATETVFVDPTGVIAFAPDASALAARSPSFESWCASNPGKRASLVLSAHLVHTLPLGPDRTAGLRDQAARTFVEYFGKAAGSWSLASAATADGAFGCASHGFNMLQASQDANRHDVALLAAVPLWACALPAAAARAPAIRGADLATLVLVEGVLATCLDLRSGRLVSLQQRHLRSASADGLADLLDRLQAETGFTVGLTFVAGWGGEPGDDGSLRGRWHALGHWQGDVTDAAWLFGVEQAA